MASPGSIGVVVSPFAIAALVATACGGSPPVDPGSGESPGLGGYGGSSSGSSGGGDRYDAGSYAPPEAGAPEADASAPNIPPISATPPTSTPASCDGGASPSAYAWASDGTLLALDLGSMETRSLGVISCPTIANPWSLTVTTSGTAYVEYDDSSLYQISLSTLICQSTAYQSGQLGFTGYEGISVGAGNTADRLYVFGQRPSSSTVLGLSDLSTFRLFQLGTTTSVGPAVFPVDLKSDAYGRLFALGADGALEQLDPSTGALLGEDHTGFDGASGRGTLLTYDGQLYFFAGQDGAVTRYDVAGKGLFPLGQVNQMIADVSATPCLSAAAMPPPEADAGDGDDGGDDGGAATPANPFSAGDAWMGTYVCSQGLTNVALVVESIEGASVTARFDFDLFGSAITGSYELTGTFDPTTREAVFTPGSWVSQPGWSSLAPVGLDGYVDLGGQTYAGNITGMDCGAFSVTR
jgi:hypothetical protein